MNIIRSSDLEVVSTRITSCEDKALPDYFVPPLVFNSAKVYKEIITSDINSDITIDICLTRIGGERKDMRRPRSHHHWSRRTSSVPKGFLRSRVLRLLNEKPMSGAEIIREMEEQTDMRWRPSPGSVYPLLSWLLDSEYTKELSDSEAGVRRYELTDEGKKFLQEDEERRSQDKGARFFGPQFDDWSGPIPEEARELVDSWRRMRRAGYELRRKLRDEYSDALAKDAKNIVDDFVEKISRLSDSERV